MPAVFTNSLFHHRLSSASFVHTLKPLKPCSYAAPVRVAALPEQRLPAAAGNGTFFLMLLCVVIFILDHVLHIPGMQALYLYHPQPQWWQVCCSQHVMTGGAAQRHI